MENMRLNYAIRVFYVVQFYTAAGQELCTCIDVALAKGGCEAVVETGPNMANETLQDRSIIDWCYPPVSRCSHTVTEVARLYSVGNAEINLPAHRAGHHTDLRMRSQFAETSKVMQKLKSADFKYDFLLNEKDLKVITIVILF
jgi:hypothetical protein